MLKRIYCSLIHVRKPALIGEKYSWYCKKCGLEFKYSNATTDTGPR